MANDSNLFLIVLIAIVIFLNLKPTFAVSRQNENLLKLAKIINGDPIEAPHLRLQFEAKDLSPACTDDSQEYVQLIESLLPHMKLNDDPDMQWALGLLDATGKLPTGILEGNLNWMGSFTECLGIRAYQKGSITEERFRGQYCSFQLEMEPSNDTRLARDRSNSLQTIATALLQQSSSQKFDTSGYSQKQMKLTWGVCWMSSCNDEEIQTILTILIPVVEAALKIKLPDIKIEPIPNSCRIKEDEPKFDAVSIFVICLYSVFGLLILGSTIYEVYVIVRQRFVSFEILENVDNSNSGLLARTLLSFSAYTNGKKILNTKNGGTMTCIHGIRFFTMAWVVLAHIYAFAIQSLPFKNPLDELKLLHNYAVQPILNGTFSVDTFYTVSGLLLTYLFMCQMKNCGGQFGFKKFFLYFFHRYWRLTPAYAMGIAFIAGIWYHIGDGPLWPQRLEDQESCRKNWWRNLLYIQNLFTTDTQCYNVGWYLGTDMQFYAVSLPILLALYRVPRFGLGIMGIYFATTTITTALVIYIRNLPGGLIEDVLHFDKETMKEYQRYVYFVPWCRMGPYLVGMLTGYILYRTKKKPQLNQRIVVCGWLLSTALGLAIIFGFYKYMNSDIIMPRWLRAVYGPGSRTAWGAVISWVIYACVVGHGGFINTILSWKALVPLSRLTYTAYLVHYYPLMALYSSQQSIFYFNHFLMIIFFLGIMITSMGFAFVFSIAFESPMMELEKIFLPREKATKDKPEPSPHFGVDPVSEYNRPYIPRISSTIHDSQKRDLART